MILRFLQATAFKLDKCLACVKEHSTWRQTKLPVQTTTEIEEFLKAGIIYVHGRDHRYRPIVVFNAYLMNPKKMDADVMIDGLTYLFEIIIGSMMIPGQIENWIFIMDLKGMGVTSLPVNAMKKVLGFLQHNYRGRLKSLYVVNTPGSIYIPWQMIKGFLEEHTVRKIQFFKKDIPEPLFEHANREQVEQKFGGTAKNLTAFWPPIFPSNNYWMKGEDTSSILITKEKYQELHKQGKLQKYKINQNLLPSTNSDKEITTNKMTIQEENKYQSQPVLFSSFSQEDAIPKRENYSLVNKVPDDKFYEYDYDGEMDEHYSVAQDKPEIRHFNPRFIAISKKSKLSKGDKSAKPLM